MGYWQVKQGQSWERSFGVDVRGTMLLEEYNLVVDANRCEERYDDTEDNY
jgi:hypothetical protein